MSFGPQEICRVCGNINYEGRIVCNKCEEPWSPGEYDPALDGPHGSDIAKAVGEN